MDSSPLKEELRKQEASNSMNEKSCDKFMTISSYGRKRKFENLDQLLDEYYAEPSEEEPHKSLYHFTEVVSKFDDLKEKLIQDTGFGSMFDIAKFNKLDKYLTDWIVNKFDCSSRSIVLGDGIQIPLSGEDVNVIFGIPSGGFPIQPCHAELGKKVLECLNCSMEVEEQNIYKVPTVEQIESFLLSEIHCDSLKKVLDAFKVAFVIYAMSMVLCPCGFKSEAKLDYWCALINPDEIAKFDWSNFVLQCFIRSVQLIKKELEFELRDFFSDTKKIEDYEPKGPIYFCDLLLQILYLDNLEIGDLKLSTKTVPRIKDFKYQTMREMINADRVKYCMDRLKFIDEFGASKLRDISEVQYSRSGVARGHGEEQGV